MADDFSAPTYGAVQGEVATILSALLDGVSEVGLPALVSVPFNPKLDIATAINSTASLSGKIPENTDGTQTGFSITIPASSTAQNYVILRSSIRGNTIGLRLSRGTGTSNDASPFGALVDGIPIDVDWSQNLLSDTQVATAVPTSRNVIFGTNFGDGTHDVVVNIPCDPSVQRRLVLFGWLLEARAGYSAPTRGLSLQAAGANLPAVGAGTNYATINMSGGYNFTAFRGFAYKNNSATTETIKVYSGTTPGANELTSISMTAGASGIFTFDRPVYDGFSLAGSAATAVIFVTPIGEM